MKQYKRPYLFEFPKIGELNIGYISVADIKDTLPFKLKRVFWTYYTPESIVRGRHAHFETEQVLIAVTGRIIVSTELVGEPIETFVLDRPNLGIYIPPNAWHTMQYSHTAIQVALASTTYDAKDYIRDYNEFKSHYGKDI